MREKIMREREKNQIMSTSEREHDNWGRMGRVRLEEWKKTKLCVGVVSYMRQSGNGKREGVGASNGISSIYH
jgi:hypothetical protein